MPPPELRRCRDSSSPVNLLSIPRMGSISSFSSLDSPPYPAFPLSLQCRRRRPPSAAARRAAPPAVVPAILVAGEVRHLLLIAMRPRPEPLRPRLAAPPTAGAAASRMPRRGRAHTPGQGNQACLDLAKGAA